MPKKRPPSHPCEHSGCKAFAQIGMRFCWRHKSHQEQVGVNAGNYKHGRYSASLPENLAAKYSTARKDKRLLELEDEIAVCIARSQQLQEKLSTYESGAAWKAIKGAIADLDECIHSKDGQGALKAIDTLKELSEKGVGEYALWKEQQEVFSLHCKLVESQRKRQLELKQFLSLERVIVLVDALTTAVNSEVPEQSTREAIVKKLNDLLTLTHNSNAAQRERAEKMDEFYQSEAEHSGLF